MFQFDNEFHSWIEIRALYGNIQRKKCVYAFICLPNTKFVFAFIQYWQWNSEKCDKQTENLKSFMYCNINTNCYRSWSFSTYMVSMKGIINIKFNDLKNWLILRLIRSHRRELSFISLQTFWNYDHGHYWAPSRSCLRMYNNLLMVITFIWIYF